MLEIQYRYTPEFNQTVTVQPDGYVSLEIGGDLKVGGRNLEQVRAGLLAKARTRLASPELTVILKEFQNPTWWWPASGATRQSLKFASN